jgi:hypothetical protein
MSTDQAEFHYSEKTVATLVRAISLERLQPYLFKARNDRWTAIQFYVKNTEVSEALYGVLQGLEVLLRNAIHSSLMKHFGVEQWYFQLPLRDAELADIAEAEDQVSTVRSTWLRQRSGDFMPQGFDPNFVVRPGRVVAELSFGFWVKLFANAYEARLWSHLQPLFPSHLTRSQIHERLMSIKTLRNRIAHHETLIKRDQQKDYAELIETIGWISPTTRDWVEHTNRFQQAFRKPIPKKPKPNEPEAQA